MVIDYLNLVRTFVRPYETNSILVIKSDAMLSCSISCQSFQPIAW